MYRVNYTAEYFKNKNDILFHNDDTVYFILKKNIWNNYFLFVDHSAKVF